ncbi:MAG TPA: methionyl-tRNA formyltransferase [Firmicutes bacterium]|nr:methionyl-tRNA formyltransferase [Bacillota bacterium]
MNFKEARLVFMGTPDISASLLTALIEEGFNVVGLVAQPDTIKGRGGSVEEVATKKVARAHGIKVWQPASLRREHEFINAVAADLIVTLAYGQIVPDEVLAWPHRGALNVHGSLLPKLRGAAPMQYALMQGLETTGFTLMEMIDRLDAGKMYAKRELQIDKDDDYGRLHAKMSALIVTEVPALLKKFLDGKLIGIPQNDQEATFAYSIKPAQEHLDVNLDAISFTNYVRALAPTPGGYLLHGDTRIKILKTTPVAMAEINEPGRIVIDGGCLMLDVASGRVNIDLLQLPGKRPVAARDYLNGHRDIHGTFWQ